MDSLTIQMSKASRETLTHRRKTMVAVELTCRSQVQWHETDTVADYRRLRREGIGFPKPPTFEDAREITFRANDGHDILLRVIRARESSKGVLLHFHAGMSLDPLHPMQDWLGLPIDQGGFVIGSAKSYDNYLLHLSSSLDLTAVSVEYRLAPEHSYPAAYEDALAATVYALSLEGERELGGPLRILAGESAGACLAIWVALALRDQHGIDVRSKLSAIIASYGIYDLTFTPSCRSHTREAVLSSDGMKRFIETAFPGLSLEQRKKPEISPLYNDLRDMPPALFLCGTEDPLVDDSLFMVTRWSMAGSLAQLCLVPGAWHAFTIIPAGEVTDEGLSQLVSFARKYL